MAGGVSPKGASTPRLLMNACTKRKSAYIRPSRMATNHDAVDAQAAQHMIEYLRENFPTLPDWLREMSGIVYLAKPHNDIVGASVLDTIARQLDQHWYTSTSCCEQSP